MFGDGRWDDWRRVLYDLIGMAVDHRHNLSLPTSLLSSNNTDVNGMIPHSLCYVDDGIGVAPHIHPAHVNSPA